jgi:hypothetical protein
MSYPGSVADAKAEMKAIEPHQEGSMAGSPILNGQASGGPEGKGEITPKTYVLGKHFSGERRTL